MNSDFFIIVISIHLAFLPPKYGSLFRYVECEWYLSGIDFPIAKLVKNKLVFLWISVFQTCQNTNIKLPNRSSLVQKYKFSSNIFLWQVWKWVSYVRNLRQKIWLNEWFFKRPLLHMMCFLNDLSGENTSI